MIKMYAWEQPFCALVARARKLELDIIGNSGYLHDICMTFTLFTPRLGFYCSIVAMCQMGQHLSVQEVFVVLPYYFLLADMVTQSFRALTSLTECSISIDRIKGFLMLEEYAPRIFDDLVESFKILENGFSVYDETDEDYA